MALGRQWSGSSTSEGTSGGGQWSCVPGGPREKSRLGRAIAKMEIKENQQRTGEKWRQAGEMSRGGNHRS